MAENGKTLKLTLKEKLLAQRLCHEDTFTRDELYQFYTLLNDKHADKKADAIFFKANINEDNCISQVEFSQILTSEYEKEKRQLFKEVERAALTKKRIRESRFRPCLKML